MNHAVPRALLRALLLLAMLGLLACQRGNPTTTGPVSFIVFGSPEELAAYQTLVAAFAAAHPATPIDLRHIPDQADYRRQLTASFAAGTPPDVMLLDYPRVPAIAAQGGLARLDPFLARADDLSADAFYAPALAAYRFEDQLWCLPQNLSSLVVYWNRDLFDAAGVPYPAAGWSQADFLAAARALTRDADGDGTPEQFGVGVSAELRRLAPFIWQAGGELVDDPANPTRLTLDQPPALDALRWFAALQTTEHVAPSAAAEASANSETRFQNGTLAMYLASRRAVPTFRTITGFVWDVAALPQGAQAATVLHSDGFCMAARAANKEGAWQFIAFASSAEGQRLLAATGRTVPSRRDVAESEAFLEPGRAPASNQVFLDAIPYIRPLPALTTWPAIEEGASREIERAFYGQATVEEAAAAAVSATQAYFAEAAER